MKTTAKKKAPIKRKKPLFGKDGYQSGGPDTENSRAATAEEARMVGEALGRGPVPTSKRTR